LTTRRYSEQQLTEMAAQPECRIYPVSVKDRFGDNGLVGVAITRQADGICEIDTFLLSCRVIGRTVETALLSFLANRARIAGATQLQGWFLPTRMNEPAKEFYPGHKFQPVTQQDVGTLWSMDLREAEIPHPQWIRLNFLAEESLP
jgi:FkbH-like protein